MPPIENQDLIEKADKAGEVGYRHIKWIERFILILIIIWLAIWHVWKDADFKKERAEWKKIDEKNTDRLFDVIQYVGKPAATDNIKEKDSLYKKRINENL